MTDDMKTLQERLRGTEAILREETARAVGIEARQVQAAFKLIGADIIEAADALDAKDALLREAREFVRGVSVASEDGYDTIGLLVELNAIGRHARALLLKLNGTAK